MEQQLNLISLEVLVPILIVLLGVVLPWLLKRYRKGKSINPIAEANVYLAYGRKQQALTVLRDSLVAAPDNQEVLNKLREIENK